MATGTKLQIKRKAKKATKPTQAPTNKKKKSTLRKTKTALLRKKSPRYLVGIGASAGGLEALRALFAGVKNAENMSFIVVQHLAPQHRSRLVEIIAQGTPIPVKEVQEAEIPQGDTIYITPPNYDVYFSDGKLHLKQPSSKIGPKPSVDVFFRSLAEEMGENAIGIILSGTGSDGAQGIRAIKAAGGVTICQSIKSAKYDGMPRAARQTDTIDMELSPEDIAKKLNLFNSFAEKTPLSEYANQQSSIQYKDPVDQILQTVEREQNVDFSQYKLSTVRRRIERRIIATHSNSIEEYARYINSHPEEAKPLFQDILISVTSFFRDEQAFKAAANLIQDRVNKKTPGQPFRAWVVGCATGEEAYSIAILISEALEKTKKSMPIQVFATDLDEQAMSIARKGLYPKATLSHMSKALREKYFEDRDQHYKIREQLREKIIFARHDVTNDPPFLKSDIVTCRNVLIYFNSALQEQVLKMFHYALDPNGLLFLGKSEATAGCVHLFEQASPHAKIFTRANVRGEYPKPQSKTDLSREAALTVKDRESTTQLEFFNSIIAGFAPDSVWIDEDQRVRHVYGEANRYLRVPTGAPSTVITKLLPPEMALEVTALFHRAQKLLKPVRGSQKHPIKLGEEQKFIQLSIVPISYEHRREFAVCFNIATPDAAEQQSALHSEIHDLSDPEKVAHLERELVTSREHLQTLMEEHETATEELQALNEELQSANEELQSTNEELETANEELQSSNEELMTLNQEVNVKSSELQTLNQRLQAIQNALFYPLLIISNNLNLIDFNPASRFMFKLSDADIGSSMKLMTSTLDLKPVLALINECFSTEKDGKMQISDGSRDYEIRVQLYRNPKGQCDGAVISFVDNSEIVRALNSARVHRERLDSILNNTPAIVTLKDSLSNYIYVNQSFCDAMGMDAEKILGKSDEELFGKQYADQVRENDFEVFKKRKPLRFNETLPLHNTLRHWLSSKFPVLDDRNKAQSLCTVALDVTEQVAYQTQLEIFRNTVSASNSGIAIFAYNGKGFHADYASDAFLEKLELKRETVMGAEFSELCATIGKHFNSSELQTFAKDGAEDERASFVLDLSQSHAGHFKSEWIELQCSPMEFSADLYKEFSHEPADKARYIILTMYDVTERVSTQRIIQSQQDELQRYSKLASLGEIAAGISHEINTPLNVISTKTDFLKRLAARDRLESGKVTETSNDIERMVKNIADVIVGLKSAVSHDFDGAKTQNLKTLIEEAVNLCGFKLQQRNIRMQLELPQKDISAECHAVQIVQILVNLIQNSVDAISQLEERWIKIQLRKSSGKAEILVTDSGKGIDESLAEKVMTPFFTTKKSTNGTGLGLSLSRNIARRHGGDLLLVPGSKNTTFRVELPIKQG
ncbi:MAG: chemotaxis protein CheB [Bdellovibrionia bacterium]